MARETITYVVDDIDGSKDAHEVKFSFDGVDYTIDLSRKNKAAFEKAVRVYVEAATKAPRRGAARGRAASSKTPRRDLSAIREWAGSQGIGVSARGRVAQSVIDQYDASH